MAPLVSMARRRFDVVAILALLVGSIWLRAGGLAPPTLWIDDAWVVAGVRADTFSELTATLATTPLFSLLSVAIFKASGNASMGAQTIPFVAGVSLAPLAYLGARRLRIGSAGALVGAVVVLVSPIHLVFSTRVKQYSLDALIGLVVVLLIIGARRRPRLLWFAVAVGSVGLLASATTAVVTGGALVAGTVVALIADRPDSRPWLVATGTFGIFGLAWWAAYLEPSVSPALYRYWDSSYVNLGGGLGQTITEIGSRLAAVASSLLVLGTPTAWIVIAAALTILAVRQPRVAAILVGPILIALAFSTAQRLPLGGGRTDIFLLPIAALALAFAVDELATTRRGCWLAFGLAAAMAVAGISTWETVEYPREDIKDLVARAEQMRGADEVIVVYPATRWAYPLYSEAPITITRSEREASGFEMSIEDPNIFVLKPHRNNPEAYRPELDAALQGRSGAWLVASHWQDDIDELFDWASENGYSSEETKAPGARLYRWTRSG